MLGARQKDGVILWNRDELYSSTLTDNKILRIKNA